SRGFDDLLQPGEVTGDGSGVALELLVADARLPPQGEHRLAAVAVRDHAHRVVEHLPRRQGHLVIQYAVRVPLDEREADTTHRRFDEPPAVDLLDGAAEPGSPLGQIRRVGGVLVDLVYRTVDPFADMPRFRRQVADDRRLRKLPAMRQPSCRRGRPNVFRRIVDALLGRAPRWEDRSSWPDLPPDIGVREPRRPRPSSSGGAAVLDPPTDLS